MDRSGTLIYLRLLWVYHRTRPSRHMFYLSAKDHDHPTQLLITLPRSKNPFLLYPHMTVDVPVKRYIVSRTQARWHT
jgi:hypothetical protein